MSTLATDPAHPRARERVGSARFCSRCGEAREPSSTRRMLEPRVCDSCGMGVLLRCSQDTLPEAGGAFLIVTRVLEVSAVSSGAELIFGSEADLLGRRLFDLVASPLGDDRLARAVGQAALRSQEPVELPVLGVADRARLLGLMVARIATCGFPRAALVTVEPSGIDEG